MSRRTWALAAAAIVALAAASAGPSPAAAQAPPVDGPRGSVAAPDATVLRLSATGTVSVSPDLLVATLAGEDRAADPATAQKALDRRMAAARTQASAGGSVTEIRLEDYQTTREDPGNGRPAAWVARQTLELRGTDDGVLLAAVGRLQAAGLALQGLDWTLSPTKRQAAEREAADVALKALQRRAAEAATSLGMRPGPFREITLGDDGAPRPRPLMRMMAMRADAPPPDATRSDQEIAETASGTIVLLP